MSTNVIDVVIGIDGGATKTECSLLQVSSRTQLGSALTGSSNKNSVGNDCAKRNLTDGMIGAVRDAYEKLSDPTVQFQLIGLCFGMSGVDRPHDKALVRSWVPDMTRELVQSVVVDERSVITVADDLNVQIYNDAIAALSSGTMGHLKDALVIISGTGMIVTGSSDGENFVRTGGWGPLLGDEGSGYSIGSEVLKACVNSEDKLLNEDTVLVDLVKKHLQIETMSQLIDFAYKDTAWSRIADLAKLAFDGYALNDNVSRRIVSNAAASLEKYIRAAANNLGWSRDKQFTLVYTGSVLTHDNSVVAKALSENLKQSFPSITITLPKVSAAIGSALLVTQPKE